MWLYSVHVSFSLFYLFRYGHLIRHWTMRFEAKHSYFKGLAHSMGSFINLPYSLAMRQQQLQCYCNSITSQLPGMQDVKLEKVLWVIEIEHTWI